MDLKPTMKTLFAFLLSICMVIPSLAQDKVVSGKVYEADGQTPIPGATIMIKATSMGTVTNIDGEYRLELTGDNPILVIQFIGFETQEIAVENRSIIDVVLKEDLIQLEAVVVTALGITREQKSLGYSVSEVESEELTKTVSGNWLNSVAGKVAGLTFDQAGSGPSGSLRVTLRGDQSLNYSANEALFIVDGVPITSGMTATAGGSNYANVDAPVDFGNGASDINPEDIESISVLKGPAATALYGSRAANGAIVITTKSGRTDKGIGISINSTTSFERAGYFPDFQSQYGNGGDLGRDEYSLWEMPADLAPDGIAQPSHWSRYAYGEKFDPEKLRYLYSSLDWDTGEFTKLPFVYQDDWYTGLFKTGVTASNTVTVDGSNGEGTNTRFSVTDFRNNWILPNTGFNRQSVSLSFNTEVNKFIKLNAKVNYYRKNSDNMPVGGYDENNAMYALTWGYNVNSINDWKNEYFEGRYNYANWSVGGDNIGHGLVTPSSWAFNPYRTLYEQLSTQDKDRVLGNIGLTFDLYEGLSLTIRTGLDWSDEFRTQRTPFYTAGAQYGRYREQTVRRIEMNNDFMLRYTNDELAGQRLGVSVVFGGNNRVYNYFNSKITLSQLGEEGIYHTTNLPPGIIPDPYNYRSTKVVNSLFGMASLSWDDTYFIDITGRNDWSSTLSANNWSYFYPSVAASILVNEIFDFNQNASWIDFMKLRLSWANVGNDTSPYSLDQYYSTTSFAGAYKLPGTIPDPMIKPENVESWETGLDVKLFQNRISFDIALYNSSTTNQIVSVAIDQITGATGMKINAGEIQNQGIELASRFVPVRKDDFEWSFNLTWSKNNNKLVSLQEGWDPEEPLQTDMGTTIGSRVYVYSFVGQEMHVIYGRGFQRAPEGAFYIDENGDQVDAEGMHIVNASGYPLLDEVPDRKIGNVNPDWRAGMTQQFRYKNFSLFATLAGQLGGNAYSVTNFALSYQGKLNNSIEGRNDGLVHEGVNVIDNGDGTFSYTKNTTVTNSILTYYNTYMWNRNNVETNTFSTSFLKLREVRLDYQLPKSLLQRTKYVQGASLAVFATNLFSISNFPQYDPETGMLDGSNIHRGIESMAFPMTRTYGVNVKVSL
ncbi:MAG: SusC/RagA family TonB-linked outer membrane protein [Bacteroidota bacterium]